MPREELTAWQRFIFLPLLFPSSFSLFLPFFLPSPNIYWASITYKDRDQAIIQETWVLPLWITVSWGKTESEPELYQSAKSWVGRPHCPDFSTGSPISGKSLHPRHTGWLLTLVVWKGKHKVLSFAWLIPKFAHLTDVRWNFPAVFMLLFFSSLWRLKSALTAFSPRVFSCLEPAALVCVRIYLPRQRFSSLSGASESPGGRACWNTDGCFWFSRAGVSPENMHF